MDRFEDQFKNAFADYRVPVSDKVWEKVKAKRKVLYWWKRPSFQIAAAILLLVSVIWSLTDSVGKFQNSNSLTPEIAEIGSPNREAKGPDMVKEDGAEKPSAIVSSDGADMALSGQKLIEEKKPSVPGKQQALPLPFRALDPVDSDKTDETTDPIMEMVSLDPDLTEQVLSGVVILPNRIRSIHTIEYKPSLRLPANLVAQGLHQSDLASNKNTLPLSEDKTGPDFLISQLENLRPGLFDGLRNIANRTTEIEIIW